MSFSGNILNETTGDSLINDGFFPDLSLDEFLRDYRLPGDYAAEMVKSHVALAMIDVNNNLEDWRLDQETAGFTTLADIPAPQIDGVSTLVRLYRRAVFCRAKAELLMQFATVTRREAGENSAKEAPETEDLFLQYSVHAQRRLMGKANFTAELL